MANFSHNMPDTLTKDMFTKKTDVEEEEEDEDDTTGRIQTLEITVEEVKINQTTRSAQLGSITQQLAEMTNLLKATQAQGPLASLRHSGPPSDASSVTSNMSVAPAHLYDTGKICFVNSQVYHGWFAVYKKRESQKTMYTIYSRL